MKYIVLVPFCVLGLLSPVLAQKKQKGFNQKQHQKALAHNYKLIKELADNNFCGNPNDFAFVPLGTNPCGGPKEYLIYAKTVDRKQFFQMVEQYNLAEAAYNKKYGIVGNCKVLETPKDIKCEKNKPIFVY